VFLVGERVKDSMVSLGDFVKRTGHVTNRPTEHRCRLPDIDTVHGKTMHPSPPVPPGPEGPAVWGPSS